MTTLVKLKRNGSFTEEHRQFAESYLRKDAFPQFYTNVEFKSLVYHGTYLFNESSMIACRQGQQYTRHNGFNPEYDKLKLDLTENGWQLYQKPISLRKMPDGTFVFLDGRTKDGILREIKFKNRIVNVFEISDEEEELFSERLNAGEDAPPAGLMLEQDLVGVIHRQIQKGYIDLSIDDIRGNIAKACGKGRFSSEKRDKLAWQIYHHEVSTQNNSCLPQSWTGGEQVTDWLKTNNYIDNNKVVYLPYSSTSTPKAIMAAASAVIKNPGKEVRVVIYVRNLTGYDLKKAYINAILKFKTEWKRYLGELCIAFFEGKPFTEVPVKLYGCVPSNLEGLCDDMSSLIIFGKNDQKIDEAYVTDNNLSSFFDIDTNEEQE